MRPSIRFELVLTAMLGLCGGFGPYGQAQTDPPRCSADGLPRDEGGNPHCCPDGSPPEGESQCWCDLNIVRGEYRNAQREYEVHLPDGVAGVVGCGGTGTGFHISLAHPDTGEREWSKIIWVAATGRIGPFHKFFDDWSKTWRRNSERIHAADLQIDEPEQTSLSSLPALRLRVARTEPEAGRMIYEVIAATGPGKDFAYQIGLATPADDYEKNRKLFKAIVDGFRYVPSSQTAKQ